MLPIIPLTLEKQDREHLTMRLHLCRVVIAATMMTFGGAAIADVTVSQSNDPTVLIADQFASLLGAEHNAVNAVPEAQLSALANGMTAKARSGHLPGAID